MHFPFFFDSTMLILIPAIIISFIAQMMVKSAYSKYSEVRTHNGNTGSEIARSMLDEAGLYDVPIEIVNSELGDHYDPRSRVLRLSPDVYSKATVAAAGIAAHEVGHALQHQRSYAPLVLRNTIAPAVNISSNLSWGIFFAGLIFSVRPLLTIGIILFTAVVLFQVVTLPVEFNASRRALEVLESRNILYSDELKGAKKVLGAAALTYVAAALMSILQLIRLIALSKRND